MKFRTRLIIAFLSVVIIPPLIIKAEALLLHWSRRLPEVGNYEFSGDAYTLLIVSLILTATAVVYWVYQSLISPIRQLTEAARKISEGNLDFELEIPEGTDEIASLCRNFEEMRQRLKDSADRAMESESENRTLISNITHDLKTPVTSIKGYAEGLLDGVADTPEKRDKYLRTIYNKANDMDRLINELTFYSGIDTNRIPYNFTRINLSAYFDDCVDEIRTELEADRIELNYMNYLDRDVMIIADPEQFKKVINNIVGNSIKYMDKEKSMLSIRLKDADTSVIIEIEDNGRGIEGKDVPYIFDRFYRADSSRNSSKGGSGIGLSIVKKIVEDHGGRVWADSQPGTGTTILMEFRKYRERDPAETAGEEAAPAKGKDHSGRKKDRKRGSSHKARPEHRQPEGKAGSGDSSQQTGGKA